MRALICTARVALLVLVIGLLGGCVKPCQVDWYRGCAEDAQKAYEQDTRVNESYREFLSKRQRETDASESVVSHSAGEVAE